MIKVVFVIKRENLEIFKREIGDRIESYIRVEYAFQELDNIPEGYFVPEGREKPWGTAICGFVFKRCGKWPFCRDKRG